ncbi:MAG: hypothetical protein EBT92_06435 [Planctomycetes bacterium]|nr:hypothetical protein [Planctomycetota bacterium]
MIINIRHAAAMTSLIVALVTGCGGETKAKTFKVSGKIHAGGNPITGLPPGEKPMVKFEAKANKEQSMAKVGEDGAFTVDLSPGDYTVTGSAGFMAISNKKSPGMISKDLKVEADVVGLDLDVGKAKTK